MSVLCSGHRGLMNTIHLWMMEPFLPSNCVNSRSRQTRHSIPTERCTLPLHPTSLRSNTLTPSVNLRYYEGGISSVYLWDLDDGGFAGVVLFKKGKLPPADADRTASTCQPIYNPWCSVVLTPASPTESSGSWDSIHVFEASERGRQAHYKLTSTIMLNMVNKKNDSQGNGDGKKTSGEIGLSGSMTRQVSSNPFCSPLWLRLRLWVSCEGVGV